MLIINMSVAFMRHAWGDCPYKIKPKCLLKMTCQEIVDQLLVKVHCTAVKICNAFKKKTAQTKKKKTIK